VGRGKLTVASGGPPLYHAGMSSSSTRPPLPGSDSFATTRWSVIATARGGTTDSSQQALAWLCERYWYPIYAYVRRKGQNADNASDLTQGFFTYLLEKGAITVADRERGRFRDFLLASLNNFLSNEWDRMRALKRGGGKSPLRLDTAEAEERYRLEPSHNETPEKLFARRWALALLERAIAQLKESFTKEGKSAHFEALKGCLASNADAEAYAAIGKRLKMSEGAVKVAVYRLRKKYRAMLKEEIARTLAHPEREDDVDGELKALFEALSSPSVNGK